AMSQSVRPSARRSVRDQQASRATIAAATNEAKLSAGSARGGGTDKTSSSTDATVATTPRCGGRLRRAGQCGRCSDLKTDMGSSVAERTRFRRHKTYRVD